jgi:hypothetical protein
LKTPEPKRDLPGSMFRDGMGDLTALRMSNLKLAPRQVKEGEPVRLGSGVCFRVTEFGVTRNEALQLRRREG